MFMVSAGGVRIVKNADAPQPNITMEIIVGMMLHVSSNGRLPSMRAPISPAWRRRKTMPKTTTATETASAKNALVAVMNRYSASTSLANVEACSGNSGIPNEPIFSVPGAVLAPNRHNHEPRQRQQGEGAAQLNGFHRHERIRPR